MYLYLQDDGPASSLASDGHIVLIIPIICIFETVDSLYSDNTGRFKEITSTVQTSTVNKSTRKICQW